ncbi:MAG: DSBA oxidoreductase [Parcubacteria group bacterium Gr01-1014_2]|nr:MAG: DSBA oxidoreductase [Parcubacteria group bacterium Gr01-1014_2]
MDEITKDQNSETKISISVPMAIIIAGVLIAGAVFYSNKGPADQQGAIGQLAGKVEVSADDDLFLGPENAKVTIIEFSDYQCPFCRSFWRDTLGQIKEKYIDAGKSVRFVYRDFPLSSIHPTAQKYAEAAECAQDQKKYWEMHDKIFEEQDKLGQGTISAYDLEDIKKWATELGLDSFNFNQCLDSGKYAAEVKKDFDDGSKAGINGTPSFFVNGKILVGAQPIQAFIQVIDSELEK